MEASGCDPEFGICDFVGEARGAGMVVNWDVCVVIDKVKVGWNVTCALGSESTEEE